MRVGFTGTRAGTTSRQHTALELLLPQLRPTELHHGDAIGADAEVHAIATALGIRVVIHPPLKRTQRAFCAAAEVRLERPFMERNRAIVGECDLLVAIPQYATEDAKRSGTWRTVRYAKALHRPVVIIWPDGTIERIVAESV